MTKLIVINGEIVGTTTPDDPNGYILIDPPEGFDGDLSALSYDPVTHTAYYHLDAFKAKSIAEIKRQAEANIDALRWRLERAEERDRLGLPGETVEEVLLEREAIRRASNRCEAEINAAKDINEVRAVTFAVTDADYAQPLRLTRLQFLRRFTNEEIQSIVAMADTNVSLKALLLKWQMADRITLTDPETVAGVNALEIAGLIAARRSEEILAKPLPLTPTNTTT